MLAALGAGLAADARQKYTVLENAAAREYVERIAGKLAEQMPDLRIKYSFTFVDDDIGGSTHEPLALPGGSIFVPSSLLSAVRNEGELAGMPAHSMAHAASRHWTRLATRLQIANIAAAPLPGSESPMGFRSMQRGFEVEADKLAVRMTSGAGYDPDALARYINDTQEDQGPQVFSTLLARDRRAAAIRAAVEALPKAKRP